MNATAPVKTRFKTLSAALEEIERLESQAIALNAALAAKTAAPVKPLTPPSVPAVSPLPPVERPLAERSKREIADMMDEANARGDKVTTDKLWREYSARN